MSHSDPIVVRVENCEQYETLTSM